MRKFFILLLSLLPVALALPLQAAPESEKSLYERLGGVFAIAAVVNHFSDAVVANPIVGKSSKNPALREWHTKSSLDFAKVPAREKGEVLAAFAAHKNEVTAGYKAN
jgi:hypothetical protein